MLPRGRGGFVAASVAADAARTFSFASMDFFKRTVPVNTIYVDLIYDRQAKFI